MKKLYSLIVASMAASTMLAGVPMQSIAKSSPLQMSTNANFEPKLGSFDFSKAKKFDFNNIKPINGIEIKKDVKAEDVVKFGLKRKKAQAKKAKAEENSALANYTSLGSGARYYTSSALFCGLYPETIENVEMYMHKTEEGQYAVTNLFANSVFAQGGYIVDSEGTMFFDASDPESVYASSADAFTYSYTYSGHTYECTAALYTYADYIIDYYAYYGYSITVDDIREAGYEAFGTLQDGVITMPSGTVIYYELSYDEAADETIGKTEEEIAEGDYDDGYSLTAQMLYDDEIFALPNAKFTHMFVDSSQTDLTTDDNVLYLFFFGGDIASTKIQFDPLYIDPTNEYYLTKVANENTAEFLTWPYYTYMDITEEQFGDEHMPLSIIVSGYDSDGNYVQSYVFHQFYQPDESAKWQSIGTGKYIDGFLKEVLSSSSALSTSKEIEIEENLEYPGYLRVKNPYANFAYTTGYYYTYNDVDYSYVDTETDHYMYLYISYDQAPQILYSTLGVDLGTYGESFGCSRNYHANVYDYYTNADDPDNTIIDLSAYDGTYNTEKNTIKFPADGLMIGFTYCDQGELYTTNSKGIFTITLPSEYKLAGVNDIINDANNGEAQYFNLQGVRIANPTPGQLVIRRQGGVSTKYIAQ